MWNGMKVIDADAHMHEPEYLWEQYVEPKFRDQVPKVAFMDGVFMVYEPDGKIIPKGEIQVSTVLPSAWAVIGRKVRRGLSAMVVVGDSAEGHGPLRLGHSGSAAHREQRQLRLSRRAQRRRTRRRDVPGLQQLVP